MVPAFIATHRIFFTRGPTEQFIMSANHFLSLLREKLSRPGHQGQHGAYIMCCNFASVLQYGDTNGVVAAEFRPSLSENVTDSYVLARERISQMPCESRSSSSTDQVQLSNMNNSTNHSNPRLSWQIAFQGSSLTFDTLSVFLVQKGDPTIYPSFHTSLAFLWCLALHPSVMRELEHLIPWLKITRFLNTLLTPGLELSIFEGASFPVLKSIKPRQFSEDFLLRGKA